MSGHSGQLSVPPRNVILRAMAAGHTHGMQIETFSSCVLLFCEALPTLAHVEKIVVSRVDAVCNFTYWKSQRLENSRENHLDAVMRLWSIKPKAKSVWDWYAGSHMLNS